MGDEPTNDATTTLDGISLGAERSLGFLNTWKRITIGREDIRQSGIRFPWYLRRQFNSLSDVMGEDQDPIPYIDWRPTVITPARRAILG